MRRRLFLVLVLVLLWALGIWILVQHEIDSAFWALLGFWCGICGRLVLLAIFPQSYRAGSAEQRCASKEKPHAH